MARPSLHMYLTEGAHDFLFDDLTGPLGCSMSGFVNAIGLMFGEGQTLAQILGIRESDVAEIIVRANKVFAARRKHKNPDDTVPEERKPLHCYMDPSALEGVKEIVEEFFSSDASFMQALADWFEERIDAIGFDAVEQQLQPLIKRARKYDADQRRRGGS